MHFVSNFADIMSGYNRIISAHSFMAFIIVDTLERAVAPDI